VPTLERRVDPSWPTRTVKRSVYLAIILDVLKESEFHGTLWFVRDRSTTLPITSGVAERELPPIRNSSPT
jgi:hypothetical protein